MRLGGNRWKKHEKMKKRKQSSVELYEVVITLNVPNNECFRIQPSSKFSVLFLQFSHLLHQILLCLYSLFSIHSHFCYTEECLSCLPFSCSYVVCWTASVCSCSCCSIFSYSSICFWTSLIDSCNACPSLICLIQQYLHPLWSSLRLLVSSRKHTRNTQYVAKKLFTYGWKETAFHTVLHCCSTVRLQQYKRVRNGAAQ